MQCNLQCWNRIHGEGRSKQLFSPPDPTRQNLTKLSRRVASRGVNWVDDSQRQYEHVQSNYQIVTLPRRLGKTLWRRSRVNWVLSNCLVSVRQPMSSLPTIPKMAPTRFVRFGTTRTCPNTHVHTYKLYKLTMQDMVSLNKFVKFICLWTHTDTLRGISLRPDNRPTALHGRYSGR